MQYDLGRLAAAFAALNAAQTQANAALRDAEAAAVLYDAAVGGPEKRLRAWIERACLSLSYKINSEYIAAENDADERFDRYRQEIYYIRWPNGPWYRRSGNGTVAVGPIHGSGGAGGGGSCNSLYGGPGGGFATRMDSFLEAMPRFVEEANGLVSRFPEPPTRLRLGVDGRT